jgi:hypothetical protein
MSVKITVAKRNGIEEIHKPGCRDLKNKRGWHSDRDDWTLTIDTLADLYREYWNCIDEEAVANGDYATVEEAWWAWTGEFKLMPCAGQIDEMAEPNGEASPEPTANGKRSANQELARNLIDLVAAQFSGATDAEKAKLANWLKSLPTGGAGAERYWPANFPRPTTADWR